MEDGDGGGAIAMGDGNGGAMDGLLPRQLLSLSKIVDRLNVIPWRHGTHDKVWVTTTITSLRKMEAEEELEEKVEV